MRAKQAGRAEMRPLPTKVTRVRTATVTKLLTAADIVEITLPSGVPASMPAAF